jgi:hypothetical protein
LASTVERWTRAKTGWAGPKLAELVFKNWLSWFKNWLSWFSKKLNTTLGKVEWRIRPAFQRAFTIKIKVFLEDFEEN